MFEIPTDIEHFKAVFHHWLWRQSNRLPSGCTGDEEEGQVELIPYFVEMTLTGEVWIGIETLDRKKRLPGGYPVNIKLLELTLDRTRIAIYAMPDFKPFAEKLEQMIREEWPTTGAGGIAVGDNFSGVIILGDNNTVTNPNRSGGTDINAPGGTVNTGGDVVGRDAETDG